MPTETISEKLLKINQIKADLKTQIEAKGVTVGNADFEDYPGLVDDIPSGSSATLITKSITQNGTYSAQDDNADGYSSVTVNVPETPHYFTNGTAVYFENHVIPNISSILNFIAINGAPNIKTYKCYAPNAHSTSIYQLWDADSIEEIECPYITNVGYVSFWITNRTDKECIRTFGSIGNPVTNIDTRAFAFNENKGTGWTCVVYVNASTLADIPSAVKDTAPWGANYLSNIVYRSSITGEVITE